MKGNGSPPKGVLKQIPFWEIAVKQALRSPLQNYRTGAVVFDNRGRILGKGCSHPGGIVRNCMHAEESALRSMRPVLDDLRARITVVTLNASGNWVSVSRPCAYCVNLLGHWNIQSTFHVSLSDGEWTAHDETIASLAAIAPEKHTEYARGMRVVV